MHFTLTKPCAALVALAGWMIQAWVATRNSKKQHTMNVLFQIRIYPKVEENAEIIGRKFPIGTPISFRELMLKKNKKEYEAVRWLLNYYEFVATGIMHGDLDERLMKDCVGTMFCSFCKKTDDVIRNARGESKYGNPDPDRARVLKSVRWLQRRWRKLPTIPH